MIVPVYNEEGILIPLAKEMAPWLDAVVGSGNWQFVFIDNGSHDATPEEIAEINRVWPTGRYVRLASPNYGEALRAGLKAAEGEWGFIINVDSGMVRSWPGDGRTAGTTRS